MNFDKIFAQAYVDALLKKYNITVDKWYTTTDGLAIIEERSIKIPKPTDVYRFGVCLHEIKHIIDGAKENRFEEEFACDLYALNTLIDLGYDEREWYKGMKGHILHYIAVAHNKGLNHSKISTEIREFFKEVNFSKWIGKKVYITPAYHKTIDPGQIMLVPNFTKKVVERLLKEKGLQFQKCASTGLWLVNGEGQQYPKIYMTLPDVITSYRLGESNTFGQLCKKQ